ncbi:MAG: putative transport system permease protein [Frankiales bacterium]|jgi:putative ABC transport system permease protein|nr:putative transport system permease protein [Frankiales bacterium]
MRLGEAFRVALGALRANRMRSVLTMLGVVIGVAAVVALVSIGTGAKNQVESEVQGLGSNLVIFVPGKFQFGSAPTLSRLRLTDVAAVSQAVSPPGGVAVDLQSGENVRAGHNTAFATVSGTNEAVPTVFNEPIARGVYFRAADVQTRRRVAVLGSATAARLFPGIDAVGQRVTVAGVRFRVIGVFAARGSAFGVSQDDVVHIPITEAQRIFDTQRVDAIAVKASSSKQIPALEKQVLAVLGQRHTDQQFSAITQDQILGTIGKILGLLTGVLAAIAAISLLVGGVGVSNIMLVSVRERTREIGLRKALGARQRDILAQFLIEAVLLTTLGGVIGIGIGIAGSLAMAQFTPVPATVAWWSPVLAAGVSAFVGIFFGVAPARRAGRLDPVVALRAE